MILVIVPNPLESDNQYDRYYHYDLPDAELSDLLDELAALRPLLWWKIDDTGWLRERVSQLQTEITRRKYSDHELPQDKPIARPKRLAGGVKL
jgi:hypothetical protein